MKTRISYTIIAALTVGLAPRASASDFHVTTAQELQNALTTAAANGSPDTIWLAAGRYVGNFNFSSAQAAGLTLLPEPGVDVTQVTIDGAGNGRCLNLVCTDAASITVRNLTFVRDCGREDNAALRVSTVGADVSAAGCRFLGTAGQKGIGLEVVSARNVSVTNCTATRTGSAAGHGIKLSGVTGEGRVEGCTVSGDASSGQGAGIAVTAATIWISRNTVVGNYGTGIYGGGIYSSGVATITENSVTGNSGGGIYASGTATISRNILTGNSAGNGGGIYSSGEATIADNTLTGNSASKFAGGNGGGIFAAASYKTVTISGNTLTGNSGYSGGGIAVGYGNVMVTNNVLTGNSASGSGGGLHAWTTTLLTSEGNRVFRNHCADWGGGIYGGGDTDTMRIRNNFIAENTCATGGRGGGVSLNPSTRLEFINNTVIGNNSESDGGGAFFELKGVTEHLYVYNNVLWGNTATQNGQDVYLAGIGQRKEFLNNNAHDLFGVWDLWQNNIDAAPIFVDAPDDDYHLSPGSSGIDAGVNAVAFLPGTDIDGQPRTMGVAPDIGADEVASQVCQPPTAPVLTGNMIVDEGKSLSASVHSTDPDTGQTITYSLVNAPNGMSIESSTGEIIWVPTEAQGPGSYTVKIVATDSCSPPLSTSTNYTFIVAEVNRSPELTLPGTVEVDVGQALQITVTATDPDLPKNTLTFSAPGDPPITPPPPSGQSPVTWVISWTPITPGQYEFTVQVTDDGNPNLSSTGSVQVTVRPAANTPPQITCVGDQGLPPNGVTDWLPFTVTDRETPASQLNVTAESSNPVLVPTGRIYFDGQGEQRYVLLMPAPGESGRASITLCVTDSGIRGSWVRSIQAVEYNVSTFGEPPPRNLASARTVACQNWFNGADGAGPGGWATHCQRYWAILSHGK